MAEDVADNWETLDDVNELDKRLKKLEDSVKNTLQDEESNQTRINRVISDPSMSSFGRPAFRILKRDSHNQSSHPLKTMASSRPVRTLEEREAAYAEARLRILGSVEEGSLKTEPVVLENTGLQMNCSVQKKSPSEKASQQNNRDKGMFSDR